MSDTRSRNTRSNDFRYLYANGLSVQFGGNDVTLIFGIKENPASPEETIREEAGVIMTPATAKLLATTLSKVIDHFEKTTGSIIPIESDRISKLDALLAAADAERTSQKI